jgi:hypothetical protein
MLSQGDMYVVTRWSNLPCTSPSNNSELARFFSYQLNNSLTMFNRSLLIFDKLYFVLRHIFTTWWSTDWCQIVGCFVSEHMCNLVGISISVPRAIIGSQHWPPIALDWSCLLVLVFFRCVWVFLTQIPLCPSDHNLFPFRFKRKQFQ